MNVIEYIVASKPNEAAQVCQQNGQNPGTENDLINGLYDIVDEQGPNGFKKVLSIHPDKDIILENFAGNNNSNDFFRNANGGGKSDCENCKLAGMLIKTNQANGGISTMMAASPYQNYNNSKDNLLIIGIVSLVVIAVIIHKTN